MRALVAESNVVTRVALRRILERVGFRVDELRDELAAACLLHHPEAPEVAFLSLDTLLVDFSQVCLAMRGAQPDVYIVAIVPENRRVDAPSVLEAGADDFIIKSASFQETEARVQVIWRALTGGPAVVADNDPRARPKSERTIDVLLHEITAPAMLSEVFSQIGLETVETCDPIDAVPTPAFSAWGPMLVLQAGRAKWLNIRLDIDGDNAQRLFAVVQRKTSYSDDRLLRVLREIMGLTEDVIRGAADTLGTAKLHIPLEPVTGPSDEIPSPRRLASAHADEKKLGLRLGGDLQLAMTLTIEPIRLEKPSISNVQTMDVLANDIESKEHRLMLLRAGTMLNDEYVRRIQAFLHSQDLSQYVKVYRPPNGTVRYLQRLSEND